MKISKLIEHLEILEAERGNIDVLYGTEDWGDGVELTIISNGNELLIAPDNSSI